MTDKQKLTEMLDLCFEQYDSGGAVGNWLIIYGIEFSFDANDMLASVNPLEGC